MSPRASSLASRAVRPRPRRLEVRENRRETSSARSRPQRADLRGHAGRRSRAEVLGAPLPRGVPAPLSVHPVPRGARFPDHRSRRHPPRWPAPFRSAGRPRGAAPARSGDPACAPVRPSPRPARPRDRRHGSGARRRRPRGGRRRRLVDRPRPPPQEPGLLLAPSPARVGRGGVAHAASRWHRRRGLPGTWSSGGRPLRGQARASPRWRADRRAAHGPRPAGGRSLAPGGVPSPYPRDGRLAAPGGGARGLHRARARRPEPGHLSRDDRARGRRADLLVAGKPRSDRLLLQERAVLPDDLDAAERARGHPHRLALPLRSRGPGHRGDAARSALRAGAHARSHGEAAAPGHRPRRPGGCPPPARRADRARRCRGGVDRTLEELRAAGLHASSTLHHGRRRGVARGAPAGPRGDGPGRIGRAHRPRHARPQPPAAGGDPPAPGPNQPRPSGRPRGLHRRFPAEARRRDRLAAARLRRARLGRHRTSDATRPMTSITAHVDDRETTALLQRLLGINTENPPGNEEPAARLLAEFLAPLGFETALHESAPARTSLVARLRGTGGGRTLVMNGHLDIGPIGTGWTKDPLGALIEDGRIYGLGVSDMKSGVAAMASAARAVVRSGMSRRGDLILMPTAGDSSGGRLGMGHLVATLRGLRADMAVVGEPTVGDVCLAHRGAVWAEVVVIGKSGQASRPTSGINAIMAMGRVLRAFETDLAPRLAAKTHPLLPAPTLNAGLIDGGIKTNVIAERCRVAVARRSLPGERADDIVAEIRECATRAVAGTGVRIEVSIA